MKHLAFKTLALLMFAPATLAIASCGGQGDVIQSSDRNIVSISVKEGTLPERIPIGGFNDAGIILVVQYSDSTTEEVPLTSAMIPEQYRHFLNEEGYCSIKILYRGHEISLSVLICETYTVNFYAYTNGVPEYTLVDTQHILTGLDAVAPEVEQSIYGETLHYYFSGWDQRLTNIVFDMDIYAVYDSIPWYTVSFFDGNSTLIDSQRIDEGQDAVEPSEEARAMEGYDFIGWDRSYYHVTKNLEIYGIYCGVSSTPYPKHRYTLEFEDAEFTNPSNPYDFSPESLIERTNTASGGKSIGYFRNPIEGTLRFTSEKAADVTLSFMIAFGRTLNLSSAVEMKVNGVPLDLNGMVVPAGVNETGEPDFDPFFVWAPYEFSHVAIAQGENEITLRALSDGPNFDCVYVQAMEELGIVQNVYVPEPVLPLSQTYVYMRAGETLQLQSEFEGVSYLSLNESLLTVTETGEVTALQSGSATIIAQKEGYRPAKIYVQIDPALVECPISEFQDGESYTVKGKVVAINTRSFIIHDGTAAIMVFQNAAPYVSIGDVVKVEGKVSSHRYSGGLIQFDNKAIVQEAEGDFDIPGAVQLTPEIVDGWEATYNATSDKEGKYFDTTDIKLYEWETKVTMGGYYPQIKIAGSDVAIEPIYRDASLFQLEEDKKYEIEGYFAGYRMTSSGYGYVQIVLTSAVEKAPEVGDISIASAEDASVVTVGDSIEISASVYGVLDATVEWSLKEENASSVANIQAKEGEPTKAVLTGIAPGTVTVVGNYNGQFDELVITVEPAPIATTLNAVELNQIVNVDVTVISAAYNGYVVADATSAVYVFDKTNKPTVGAHLALTAKVKAYNGGIQLIPEDGGYVVAEGEGPAAPAATVMTEAVGLELIADLKVAKEGSTFADPTKVGLYTFENVLVGGSGNYMTWEVGSAHFETNNTADVNKPVAGKNFNITGLVYGSYTNSNMGIDYATVIVVSAEEVAPEQTTWQLIHGNNTVNYSAVALELNPYNEHEYMASVHLEAGEEVWFQNDVYDVLLYANIKDGCKSLFDEVSFVAVVKETGTYVFYIEDAFAGQCIWADYAADPVAAEPNAF